MTDQTDILNLQLDQLSGAQIAGRFRLGRMLGQGGYGAVYEAEQTSVRRRCAVKVLVPHVAANPRNTQRFEREARLTSQMAHPNTVVIYDFGLDEERQLLFLAMEYIDGESLREIIRLHRTLSLETTLHITHQIARSLQDAHDGGLVHRDMKPHNVMVTTRAGDPHFVKVIDFGIAKFLGDEDVRATSPLLTMTGMIIGTPAYMAPEQVRNEMIDGRTDQYALAVCVYQMLTGRTVFTGETPVDIATHHLMQAPLPLRAFNPSLPVTATFENVLLRALAKEPSDRYPSIAEFADALVRASGISLPSAFRSSERERELREVADARTESMSLGPVSAHAAVDPLARTATTTEPEMPDAGMIADGPTPLSDTAPDPIAEATPVPEASMTPQPMPASALVPSPALDDSPGYTLQIEPPSVTNAPREELDLGSERAGAERDVRSRSPRSPAMLGAMLVALGALGGLVAVVGLSEQTADDEEARSAKVVELAVEPPQPKSAVTRPPVAEATPVVVQTTAPAVLVAEQEAPAPKKEAVARKPAVKREPALQQEVVEPAVAAAKVEPRPVEPDPPKALPGSVTVTLLPWGSLFVDGKLVGDESKTSLSLDPGTHRIELRQNGERRASKTIEVRPGQKLTVELIAK